MNELIKVAEYTEWEGELTNEDVDFLSAELESKITVRRELRNGSSICVLNPNQYVGLIALPSGARLQITPKVPLSNLFYMISIVFDIWPFRDEFAQLEKFEDVLSVVAEIFAGLVEQRLDIGLYRSYVEEEENLTCVRGRINFTEDLRQNLLARQRVYCRFTEFTWDIEENQVIRQVIHLLSGWGFRTPLRLKLSQLDTALTGIQPTALPASVIERFRYNRLNDDYRQIHQLCRLFLEGSSVSEQLGTWDSRTFLLDMNKLFEVFVTELLQNEAIGSLTLAVQSELALGEGGEVTLRPDLLIRSRGVPVLVADCKYKETTAEAYINQDYYQVLAYCIATGARKGVLIYPLGVGRVDRAINVRNTNVIIGQTAINLGLPLTEFKAECDHFAEAIFARAGMEQEQRA